MTIVVVLHCLAGLLHVGVVEYYIVASLHPRKSCHFCYFLNFVITVAVAPDLKKKLGWSSVRYFLSTITAVWKIGQELQRIIDGTKAVSVCSLNMYIYWPFKINTFLCLAVGMPAWFQSKSRVVMHDVAILISFQTRLKTNVAWSCHWNEEHVLKILVFRFCHGDLRVIDFIQCCFIFLCHCWGVLTVAKCRKFHILFHYFQIILFVRVNTYKFYEVHISYTYTSVYRPQMTCNPKHLLTNLKVYFQWNCLRPPFLLKVWHLTTSLDIGSV